MSDQQGWKEVNNGVWIKYEDYLFYMDYKEFLMQKMGKRVPVDLTFDEWKEKYKNIK